MKAYVNENCIGCGMCAGSCPEVFYMNDAVVAEAITDTVPSDLESAVYDAIDNCPVQAIESI